MHESNVLTHGSNALRRLEELLTEAVTNGDGNELSGLILLRAMKLSEQPQNIVDFYELLSKAEEEAKSIRNKTKIDRSILRTKFEQVLRLKPSSCREQDLFSQVRGRANFDKIARPLNYKL